MVTVVDYVKQKTEDGKEFIRLLLQGDDLTLCTTDAGRVYAKVSKASIIAAISEEVAKQQIGKKLKGTIEKVDSEPWTYVNKETGEVEKKYPRIPEDLTCGDCARGYGRCGTGPRSIAS